MERPGGKSMYNYGNSIRYNNYRNKLSVRSRTEKKVKDFVMFKDFRRIAILSRTHLRLQYVEQVMMS